MSNLADLVLAAEEPDLEDPLLQEELARLQARRAATPPVTASLSRPTSARPTSARVASQVEKPVAQLADAILARAEEAEETIDKELEEMDRQLKLQVEQFRRQQRRDSQDEVEDMKEPPEASTSEVLGTVVMAAPEAQEELEHLKHLAAQMDEAFPEAAPAGDLHVQGVRRRPLGGYQELPTDGPLDEEVSHFKSALEHLDVKLRALQKKQEFLPEESEESKALPPQVAELQTQNQVLRELLSGERRKGRLNLDRKIFGTTPMS